MFGGEEDPCVSPDLLNIIRAQEDRACPRVELRRDNLIPANLLMLSLTDHDTLAPLWFETQCDLAELDVKERAAIVARTTYALGRDDVCAFLRPPPIRKDGLK